MYFTKINGIKLNVSNMHVSCVWTASGRLTVSRVTYDVTKYSLDSFIHDNFGTDYIEPKPGASHVQPWTNQIRAYMGQFGVVRLTSEAKQNTVDH